MWSDARRNLRRNPVVALVVVLGVMSSACGAGDAPSNAAEPDVVDERLRWTTVPDPFLGGDAYSILVPDGWTMEGGIAWQPDALPLVSSNLLLSSPDGTQGIQFHQGAAFQWSDDLAASEGTVVGGLLVRQPQATDAFLAGLIEFARPGALDVEIGTAELDLGGPTPVTWVRHRVAYEFEGTDVDEEFVIMASEQPGLEGTTLWQTDALYSIWAPAEVFDQEAPLLHSIAASFTPEPLWSANVAATFTHFATNSAVALSSPGSIDGLAADLSEVSAEVLGFIAADREAQRAVAGVIEPLLPPRAWFVDDRIDGELLLPDQLVCAAPDDGIVLTEASACPSDSEPLPRGDS